MKNMILGLAALASVTFVHQTSSAQTRQADSLALVDFYNTNCGTGCTLSWDLTQPMDTWNGVTVTNGRVTRLSPIGANLTGALPDLNLTNLDELLMNPNPLTGDKNQLSGNIPDFSNMPSLTTLNLWDNNFTGSIPDFSNMSQLERLNLNDNQLTGSIPNFTNIPNLNLLQLRGNNLTSNIPNFSNLPNLTDLFLNGNNLTGSIPDFANLSNLNQLVLAANELTGNIPNFSNLPNLTLLNLNSNQLTDNIPDFSSLTAIERIFLDDNELEGTIPDLSTLSALNYLSVNDNNFTFEDLLPNYSAIVAQITDSSRFVYAPQNEVPFLAGIVPSQGMNYPIDLGIDNNVTTNTYYWYKDGVLLDSTTTDQYTIMDFQAADNGVYTAEVKNSIVTNPNSTFQNLILVSEPFPLSIPVSTNTLEAANFTIAPNPIQDVLSIQATALQGEFSLRIYNLQGILVYEQQGTGSGTWTIPFHNQSAGMYIVEIQQGEYTYQQKVVKQ